jgi:DNA repair exonuclease SbcCD nuclease subunit
MADDVRILLLADSHLGFDLPVSPRVDRRRRGHDFLSNYAAALAPALAGNVDIVVHAGDVFDRSRPVSTLAWQAFEPLRRVAERGVHVFLVPGNHERSRLPHLRFASHPRIHVFDTPRTFVADVRGTRIALSGFPYERENVRSRFVDLTRQTAWMHAPAAAHLLCMHHCVEGATVGPGDYTFTTAADVVRLRDVPDGFAAVLSGHIHRHQVLTTDLDGRPIGAPVLYPGSIERTSYAEMDEPKGFMILHVRAAGVVAPVQWRFCELPARPMIRKALFAGAFTPASLKSAVRSIIEAAPRDAVLTLRVSGTLTTEQWRVVSGPSLRALAPRTMNIAIRDDAGPGGARRGLHARDAAGVATGDLAGRYYNVFQSDSSPGDRMA